MGYKRIVLSFILFSVKFTNSIRGRKIEKLYSVYFAAMTVIYAHTHTLTSCAHALSQTHSNNWWRKTHLYMHLDICRYLLYIYQLHDGMLTRVQGKRYQNNLPSPTECETGLRVNVPAMFNIMFSTMLRDAFRDIYCQWCQEQY